jgi:hypothetical protein
MRNNPSGAEYSQDHDCYSFEEEHRESPRNISLASLHEGDEKHHGNGNHILKDQDSKVDPALRAIYLGSFLQKLEDYGRAAQGYQEAEEYGFSNVLAEHSGYEKCNEEGRKYLEGTADKNRPFELPEAFHGKFEADGEKEQHHPYFSQDFHLVNGADQTEPVRSRQYACQKETDNGRDAQLVAYIEHTDGQPKDDHNVAQKRYLHEMTGSPSL